MDKYLPTGNDFVSLPRINERTGGIEDITFLYMATKGLIDIRGSESTPLIQPYVHLDGDCAISPACLAWTRLDDWLPQSTAQLGSLELKTLYMPPIDERGFAIQMTVHNTSESAKDVVIGLNGCWASSWHCVNEDKPLSGKATCFRSGWNSSLIFEYHAGFPMFAFAPMADAQTDSSFTCSDDGSITYDLSHHCTIAADGTASVVFYWGLGFEEVAAATSAKEMLRQTFDAEITKTRAWLQERRVTFNGEAKLTQLYNTNLFFCMFFSTGITLDTEELVLVTSRSPRYYVSAAYWDRDSLLWSFPAILDARS